MTDKINDNIDNYDENLIEEDDFPEIMEDNFNDDMPFEDEHYESSDDTNEDVLEDFDEIDDTKPSQKNGVNWFNIGIIGAVILGIGGITYSFFPGLVGGNKAPQQQVQKQNPQTENQTASQPEPVVSYFNNPELLNDEDPEPKTSETGYTDDIFNPIDATPTISDDEMQRLFDAIPETAANVPSSQQDIEPSEMAEIDTLPMPSDSNPVTMDNLDQIDVIEQVANEVVPSVDIEQINARMDAMNDQMESFMQRLESKIENLSVPSSQTVTVDNSDQIKALQQSISKLETRLSALAEQTKSAPTAPAPTPVITMQDEEKPVTEKPKDVLLPTPEPTKTVSAPKRREPAYAPPKMTYELRGASNGQAVIALKGTQNLQTINVGSIVRGLGTIRSIAIENGQWVVRGTSGIVRQ